MKYLHKKIRDYLRVRILPDNILWEIDPLYKLEGLVRPENFTILHSTEPVEMRLPASQPTSASPPAPPHYLLINGSLHYWTDIQSRLREAAEHCDRDTRLVIIYFSQLWQPLIRLASLLGIRPILGEMNWLAPADVDSMLRISGYELIEDRPRVLLPIYIPFVSDFVNRYLAPLPLFNLFCLLHIATARKKTDRWHGRPASVSVVVPARNEAGHIEQALERVPLMSPEDELIFIEGNSTDDTWERICTLTRQERWQQKWGGRIKIAQQDGKGKGDAVRKGFSMATGDILMILDADLTVPPEDLPKFYRALLEDAGEYINGSRLVYPMEKKAMRFFNMLGNKFFALAFSEILGTRFKDTLCGTKVLSREHYQRLAANRSFFGDFDPFGDFDLIFGACRMGLKMVEVPIRYRERQYGDTNISRWRHGAILFRMLAFAARKIYFT
ncbi:MAG: hypothetical protein RI973_2039 [Bacteroidota bacterium]|jgi:hypothetical protein